MARHLQFTTATDMPVFFCDPQSRGSAAPTRTPTACCGSTSPRAQTWPFTPPTISPPSPPSSTPGHERPWIGSPQPTVSLCFSRHKLTDCCDDRW